MFQKQMASFSFQLQRTALLLEIGFPRMKRGLMGKFIIFHRPAKGLAIPRTETFIIILNSFSLGFFRLLANVSAPVGILHSLSLAQEFFSYGCHITFGRFEHFQKYLSLLPILHHPLRI